MRALPIAAVTMLCCGTALAQSSVPRPPASAGAATSPAPAARPPASTPDSRSAAALAITREPTFDAGTVKRIKDAALSYADIAVRGGWPVLAADPALVSGGSGPAVDLLRRRLVMSGDVADAKPGTSFDDTLVAAVKRFQARHGLALTGLVTPRTLAAMNVSVAKRIQQLEASLGRLQNMEFGFGERYVVVNIPAAYVEAVENDTVVRRYRAIVGKTEKPSPTLTAQITDINLNPTWTVPESIVKTEIAAHMRKDPGYLARMHMQLLDDHGNAIDPAGIDWSRGPSVTVRQDSGAANALGNVRIDMPNPYSVYMHDTNQRSLFSDDYRFDSHGCTRVDNVRDLAAWLLRDDPKWNRAAIDAGIASGERIDVRLAKNVPVAWIYLTAWMTRDEIVQFRTDIYNQDEKLEPETAEELAFNEQVRSVETARATNPVK
jgi:murein L,D-transpeptidase YcbB/YkuD